MCKLEKLEEKLAKAEKQNNFDYATFKYIIKLYTKIKKKKERPSLCERAWERFNINKIR